MMKKLTSLILVLALLVGSMSISFAAPSDVTDEDQIEAIDVLTALGVVDGYPDGTYKPENVVTRAEMAKLIVTQLGYANLVSEQTVSFSDVNGHWASGYIELCADLGIVKGYTDGTFKPDDTITYNEAATIVVRALGYTDEVLTGSWPANYMAKATAEDIFDDVDFDDANDGATRGNIAVMLFNTLLVPIGSVDYDGDYEETVVDEDDDGDDIYDTMLLRLDGYQADESFVVEGDEDAICNLAPYVGVYCDAYYNEDDEIILLIEDSTVLEGDFDDDTFESDEDYTIKDDIYDEDDGEADIMYFVNGEKQDSNIESVEELLDEYDLTDDDYVTISADVSGKTIKDIYAVSVWVVSDDDYFDEDDAEDIEDQELFGFDFNLDDDGEIDYGSFQLIGVDDLSDIAEDDVVFVYANEDDEITRVAVGTEVVSGEVTKINSDEDDIYIDGTKYETPMEGEVVYDPTVDVDTSVDDEVDVYLNAYGYIYDIEISSSSSDYAVVLELGDGDGSGSSISGYDPAIKLLLDDESDETFDVDADEDDVDSDLWVDEDPDGEEWDTSEISPYDEDLGEDQLCIVEYGTDDDGDIDELKVLSLEYEDEADITSKGYYDGYKLASDVVIFDYDTDDDADDEDSYDVIDRDDALDTDDVTAFYYVDDDDEIAVMFTIEMTDSEDAVYGLVYNYWETTGDYDYEVQVYVDGDKVTYSSDEDPSDYKKDGNVYLLDFNSDGAVSDYTAVVDEDEYYNNEDNPEVVYTTDSVYGVIVDDDILYIYYTEDDYEDEDEDEATKYTLDEDTVIYKYTSYGTKSTSDLEDACGQVDGDEDDDVGLKLYDLVDDDGVVDTILYED
jgi:hypothetical protein